MATLRETLQAEIDASKARIDVIKAKLQAADANTQSVLGLEYGQVAALVAIIKTEFPELLA